MPQNKIADFSVDNISVLDKEGNCDNELMPDLTEDKIKEMYHLMILTRTLDEKLFNLQRSGKIGTYAQVKGQEASEIGSGFALLENDWLVPSFREMGVFIARKVPLKLLVQGWNGDTRAFAVPEGGRNLPISIPIASQCLHATGIAWASKLKEEKDVTIVYFGEGATAEGDFHEALNFASTLNLPIVFFCQKNGWAISTPSSKEMNSQSIAQKAIAYNIKGIQVDGNDILAVYRVTNEALNRARNGEGPTLIESITYRMGDHTTSDDSSKYRTQEEMQEWGGKDPILRVQKYFEKIGTWNDDYKKWLDETVSKEVEKAIEEGLKVPSPDPSQLFNNTFKEKPWMLIEQEKEMLEEIQNNSEGENQNG